MRIGESHAGGNIERLGRAFLGGVPQAPELEAEVVVVVGGAESGGENSGAGE